MKNILAFLCRIEKLKNGPVLFLRKNVPDLKNGPGTFLRNFVPDLKKRTGPKLRKKRTGPFFILI